MRRIRRHLSFANVVSVIALFAALSGGTAVALTGSNTVQSDDLGPGAQVRAADVAANAVKGSNAEDSTVNAEQSLTLNAVTGLLAAGNHTFGLACNQFAGDIIYDPTYVSAVALGPG